MKNLFYTSPKYLQNLKGIESSASKIDAVSNVIDNRLAPIHTITRSACNGINNNVKFIRIGDSTRSIQSSEWQTYDEIILRQLNIKYYNNADPSQTAYDWLNNIDQNTFQEFLDNCNGTAGEDTIVEFSLGLNDFTAFGSTVDVKPQVKQILIDSINAIFTSKPKIKLYLASPHYAQHAGRRTVLQECYQEISSELNLFLVDGQEIPIGPTYDYDNTDYYIDGTHLNQFGMLSLNFFILNKILPLDVIRCIEFSEYIIPQEVGNLAEGLEIKTGLWNNADGDYFAITFNANTNYRWIEVPILNNEVRQRMSFKHQGDRIQLFFVYNDDSIERIIPSSRDADGYRPFFVTANVKKIYLNLSSDGANYDLLNDTPILKYYFRQRAFIPYAELVTGFKSNISHSRFRNGKMIDDYGFYGKNGQSLKIDSNNKMKWSV